MVQRNGSDRTLVVVKIITITSRAVVTGIHAYDVVTVNKQLQLRKEKKTNLMPLILLFIQYSLIAQHVSAVNTTIFRSLRLTG